MINTGNDNKLKSTKNGKKSDGKFRSKHVGHSPEAESARAAFGLDNRTSNDDRTSR